MSQANALEFLPGSLEQFGVEFEATVVDRRTGAASPIAPALVEAVAPQLTRGSVADDMFASTFEYATGICSTMEQMRDDFGDLGAVLGPQLQRHDAALLGIGLHPTLAPEDAVVSPTPRYRELLATYQWAVRNLVTTGLHVHVGMPDGDTALRVASGLQPWRPLLTALAASSPFARGQVTGIASTRMLIWRGFPRSGALPPLRSWADYCALIEAQQRSGAVQNVADHWWDVRPKPMLGTLEIRVCDTVPDLQDAAALTALVRCLAVGLATQALTAVDLPREVIDENLWRATRDGVRAQVITGPDGGASSVPDVVEDLIAQLGGVAADLDCGEELARLPALAAGARPYQQLVLIHEAGGMAAVIDAATVRW